MAKPLQVKLNKPICLPCKGRWVQLVALRGIGKTARTLSPCRFWHLPSFARGQYQRTAPVRKIRNLSHFLEVSQLLMSLKFCRKNIMWRPMIARFQAPRILYIFTKTTYITRNRKSSGSPESVSFLGRGGAA